MAKLLGAYEKNVSGKIRYLLECNSTKNLPGLKKGVKLCIIVSLTININFEDVIFTINGKDFALNSTEYIRKV